MAHSDSIDMMALLRQIAPLPRTLACDATDQAYEKLKEFVPELRVESYATGKPVWSWKIPQRWELDHASVRAGGKTLIDSNWHPLHVLNYSQPFQGTVSREELLAHLMTHPERPNAIPFGFSFYEKRWGFCVPHEWLAKFQDSHYEVEIKSRFVDGDFRVGSYFLKGENPETFIVCSNICHPTQANDSLTGLAVAADIAERMRNRKQRKYSYLFLFVPETIGSIAFLAHHPEWIQNSVGGIFTEMLGTPGPFVGQLSRSGDSYWDWALKEALSSSGKEHKTVPFLKSAANDEKVLDSPGVDIPAVSITRYPYAEYHTSEDSIDLIDAKHLRESRDVVQNLIDLIETDCTPTLKHPGPVFLSGHGLYPDWRSQPELKPIWDSFLDVMYSIDGKSSLLEIAARKSRPFEHVKYWCDAFASKGLLERSPKVIRKPRVEK